MIIYRNRERAGKETSKDKVKLPSAAAKGNENKHQ